MGFLARECGWTIEYILDNLTMQQVQLYFENIQYVKIDEIKSNAGLMGNAVAYGSGNLKGDQFQKFLNSLDPRNNVATDQFKEMKAKGLPIEEI